jgi:hypothetical protein
VLKTDLSLFKSRYYVAWYPIPLGNGFIRAAQQMGLLFYQLSRWGCWIIIEQHFMDMQILNLVL